MIGLDSGILKTYNSAVQEYAYIHDEDDIPPPMLEVPFLEAFSKEHLDQVLHASAFIECDPGDVIIAEGDEASRIFILLAGEVAVVKGGEQLVTMDQTGDIFGELAALGVTHVIRDRNLGDDEAALEDALAGLGVPRSEEICLRGVQTPVRLELSSPDTALSAAWGAALASSIRPRRC